MAQHLARCLPDSRGRAQVAAHGLPGCRRLFQGKRHSTVYSAELIQQVNGVAELHSQLIKATIFKDFVEFFGVDKFTNVSRRYSTRRCADFFKGHQRYHSSSLGT
jgi:glucan phosphorylase